MDRSQAFVLVGAVGAGKSSLFQALLRKDGPARKTQAVVYEGSVALDTPGEFFSHPRMYTALIQTTADVGTVVYVHDCSDTTCRLPPGLLDVYGRKRVLAVISKTDLPGCDPDAAEALLRRHGFQGAIRRVSLADPASIDALRDELAAPAIPSPAAPAQRNAPAARKTA
jgi:ethanolamine utilization protein EutP